MDAATEAEPQDGKARLVIEPIPAEDIVLRVLGSWSSYGALIPIIQGLNGGVVIWPIRLYSLFLAAGILRGLLLAWFYRGHRLRIDDEGFDLVKKRRTRRVPLFEISQVGLASGNQGWGFGHIWIEKKNMRRVTVHKVAVFTGEIDEKKREFAELAPELGFRKVKDSWRTVGAWAR
ncbi:hypothetical protein [Streptomonospora litoralis]|nr:hypothetical protein [Streptomonospora litoralis]